MHRCVAVSILNVYYCTVLQQCLCVISVADDCSEVERRALSDVVAKFIQKLGLLLENILETLAARAQGSQMNQTECFLL